MTTVNPETQATAPRANTHSYALSSHSKLVSAPQIARNSPVKVPKAVSSTVKLAEKLAPRAVAKTAARLWWTPPSPKKFTVIPGGEVTKHGAIEAQIFGEGPNVYLVHGWGGHRGQLGHFVEPLVDAGYRVIAYDAPSHGFSGPGVFGKGKSTIYEMMDALAEVIATFGPARAVIAHSLGGAATSVRISQGLSAERVVLVCPPTDPIQFAVPFGKALGLSEKGVGRMIARIAKLAGHRNSHADVITQLHRTTVSLPPVLVLSDTKDKEVDYRDGIAIAEAWNGSTLEVSEGLGHRRILKDQGVVERVVAFVSEAN